MMMSDMNTVIKLSLSMLPMTSRLDIAPNGVTTVRAMSIYSEFPEKVFFGQKTSGCFEIDEVSLRPWRQEPRILQSRDRGDRIDFESVDEFLRGTILPASVDLMFTVRNVSSSAHRFVCGIKSRSSIWERRERLLREGLSCPWWWGKDHQRIVDLSEEETGTIEAALARGADGSPRQDLRTALG